MHLHVPHDPSFPPPQPAGMARRAAAAQATVFRHVLPQYYHRVVPLHAYVRACAPEVLDAVAHCDATRLLLDGLVGVAADAPPADGDGLARVEAEGGAWPLLAVCAHS